MRAAWHAVHGRENSCEAEPVDKEMATGDAVKEASLRVRFASVATARIAGAAQAAAFSDEREEAAVVLVAAAALPHPAPNISPPGHASTAASMGLGCDAGADPN